MDSPEDKKILTSGARLCERQEFSGNGFSLRGVSYNAMFVSTFIK